MDIRQVLNDVAIRLLMDAWRRAKSNLIRTIPEQLHERLRDRTEHAFRETPFDQKALQNVVAQEGKISGNNLRRATRDQTNNEIGQLTRARHELIAIESYVWRTSGDERMCPHPGGEQRPDVRPDQRALRYRPLWPGHLVPVHRAAGHPRSQGRMAIERFPVRDRHEAAVLAVPPGASRSGH